MFDIFCHKITFVFQDTQVEINDLLDFLVPDEAPHKGTQKEIEALVDPQYSPKKQLLVDRLNAILDTKQNKQTAEAIRHDRVSKKSTDEKDKKL